MLRSRQDCVGEVVVKEAHFVIDQPPNKLLERTRDQIVCGPLSSSVSARGIATNRGFNVKKGAEGAGRERCQVLYYNIAPNEALERDAAKEAAPLTLIVSLDFL